MRTLTLRIDFFISRRCTNRCVFCSESFLMTGKEMPFETALRQLVEERKRGAGVVQFMGGEPTLHSRFLDLARAAKKLGYRTFIITNGTRMAEPGFCAEAFPWLDEIMFSLHGWDQESHTAITRNPRSWERLMRAFTHASRGFTGRLFATTTVIAANYAHLTEIAARAADFGCRDYQVVTVVPEGRGGLDFAELHPTYTQMGRELARAADFCARRGVEIHFSAVPLCILGPHWDRSEDVGENFRIDTSYEIDRPLDLWREPGSPVDWSIEIGRVKAPACRPCAWKDRCGGVYKVYLDAHGDRELRPVLP